MKKKDKHFNFIPHKFKFVGLGMVFLAVLFVVLAEALQIEIILENKATAKVFFLNWLILGLLFIAWSRDKVEDEMTVQLKIKALARGFMGAIVYTLVTPFIDLIFNDPVAAFSAQGLALFMLLTYLISYYLQKYTGQE